MNMKLYHALLKCVLFPVLLLIFSPVLTRAEAPPTFKVTRVVDGDTFVIHTGEFVRLLDINTPEISHRKEEASEPFAQKAKEALKNLVDLQTVTLEFGPSRKDRHRRLLAHVYLKDGTWVNKALVEQGLAHVYSFPDNRLHARTLLSVEKTARQENKGLWSHPRWKVLTDTQALTCTSCIGRFYLVEGTVQAAVRIKNTIYLNFGENWRTDFTVEIPAENMPLFQKSHINPLTDYTGKHVLIRGPLKPVNGVLVTATHPEQLTVLE